MPNLTYPLTLDAFGSLSTTEVYSDKVAQAIMSAILTEEDERVWRPEYGRDLRPFDSIGDLPRALGELRQSIALGLEGFQDVSFELAGSIGDEGALEVEVAYWTPEEDPRTLTVTL